MTALDPDTLRSLAADLDAAERQARIHARSHRDTSEHSLAYGARAEAFRQLAADFRTAAIKAEPDPEPLEPDPEPLEPDPEPEPERPAHRAGRAIGTVLSLLMASVACAALVVALAGVLWVAAWLVEGAIG